MKTGRISSYIPTLDGWRAVAIGLVLLAHADVGLRATGTRVGEKLADFFSHAGYGVDIFFALSGFLICTLLLQEKARVGRISLGRFYTRRVFRILPPIVLYLSALVVLRVTGVLQGVSATEIFAVLGFARNYVEAGGHWPTGHFWSLAVEEHFYLIMPLILACLGWKNALRIIVALAVASAVTRWAEFQYMDGFNLQFRTENRLDGLMYGAALAVVFQQPALRERVAKVLGSGLLMVGLLVVTVGALEYFSSQPARRLIVALSMPLFIGHTVLRPTTWIGRLLENGLVRWIGRLSYSLYIWQQVFVGPERGFLGPLQYFPWATLLAFPCAIVSYYLVEKPMIRLGHRLAASPGSRAAGDVKPDETPVAVGT